MEKLTEGYGLIEGPVWDPARGLLFSDVQFGGVFSVTDGGEVNTVLPHRRGIGGMALHSSGDGLVVGGRNVAYKPFDGTTVELLTQDPVWNGAGFNDLTADAEGRVYVGELRTGPFADTAEPVPGVLWLIDLDGSVRQVADDILLTNGLAFTPDGRSLYHADSRRGVMRYAVTPDGSLGPKELFVTPEHGSADGLVVSQDGAVWVALAGGGAGVAVYQPDGTQRAFHQISVPMCTSVCFGGPDLTRLYIVSGSSGAESDRAGAVWVLDTDVPGVPVAAAAIDLGSQP